MSGISAAKRYPGGRKKPEYQPRHAGANNLAARVHEGFRTFMKLGLRPEWASQIGVLHLEGRLTELEMQAAILYTQVAARYDHYHPNAERMKRTTRSQVYEISRGEIDEIERHRTDGTIGEYEHRARRARKKWQQVESAIADRTMREVLDLACLYDQKLADAHVPQLKLALATVAAKFGLRPYETDAIVENRRREKEMPTSKRVRLAVEAIARWFEEAGDTPSHFRLGMAKEKERGIMVSGRDRAGGNVSRTVLIRCHSRDLFAHIDSLFLKSCELRGWHEQKG